MGQAKRRGTFEERKAEAIKKETILTAKRKAEDEARWAAMTPEERRRRNKAGLLLALIPSLFR